MRFFVRTTLQFLALMTAFSTASIAQEANFQNFLRPLPYSSNDTRRNSYNLVRYRTLTPGYVQVHLQTLSKYMNSGWKRNCEEGNAAYRFLQVFGIRENATYTVFAKIRNNGYVSENIPVLTMQKNGNRCRTAIIESAALTPLLKLDNSYKIDIDIEIVKFRRMDIKVAQTIMNWVALSGVLPENLSSAADLVRAEDGVTPKDEVVLSKEEKARVSRATNAFDEALEEALQPFGRDTVEKFSTNIDVRTMKGRWFSTGLGSTVSDKTGKDAANIAIYVEHYPSIFLPSDAEVAIVPELSQSSGNSSSLLATTVDDATILSELGLLAWQGARNTRSGKWESDAEKQFIFANARKPSERKYVVPIFLSARQILQSSQPFFDSSDGKSKISFNRLAEADGWRVTNLANQIMESSNIRTARKACRLAHNDLTRRLDLTAYDSWVVLYSFFSGSILEESGHSFVDVCGDLDDPSTIAMLRAMNIDLSDGLVRRELSYKYELEKHIDEQVQHVFLESSSTGQIYFNQIAQLFNENVQVLDKTNLFSTSRNSSKVRNRDHEDLDKVLKAISATQFGCHFRLGGESKERVYAMFESGQHPGSVFDISIDFDATTPEPAKIKGLEIHMLNEMRLKKYKEHNADCDAFNVDSISAQVRPTSS